MQVLPVKGTCSLFSAKLDKRDQSFSFDIEALA
jgi:hypothetical protein